MIESSTPKARIATISGIARNGVLPAFNQAAQEKSGTGETVGVGTRVYRTKDGNERASHCKRQGFTKASQLKHTIQGLKIKG